MKYAGALALICLITGLLFGMLIARQTKLRPIIVRPECEWPDNSWELGSRGGDDVVGKPNMEHLRRKR